MVRQEHRKYTGERLDLRMGVSVERSENITITAHDEQTAKDWCEKSAQDQSSQDILEFHVKLFFLIAFDTETLKTSHLGVLFSE